MLRIPLRKLKLQFIRNPDGTASIEITLTFSDGLVVRLDDIPLQESTLEVTFEDLVKKADADHPTSVNIEQKAMNGRRKTENPPMRKMRYRGLERHGRLTYSQRQTASQNHIAQLSSVSLEREFFIHMLSRNIHRQTHSHLLS